MLVLGSLGSPAGVPSSLSVHWPPFLLNLLVDCLLGICSHASMSCWRPQLCRYLWSQVSTLNSLHFPTLGLFICFALARVGREEVGTLEYPEQLAQALGNQEYFLRLARQLPLPKLNWGPRALLGMPLSDK